ncbi:MAG: CMP-N,N'-diacetyllegionaminic acid synthase [Candidatus Azotimanducaceae bacterium]|jgi:N-acylneuraminate cytidylyltransferase
MTHIALIPLRKGSKGLPGKNLRELAGLPLFLHSVKCATAANIDRVIVTTDFDALPNVDGLPYELFQRSDSTAIDAAPTHLALLEVIEDLELSDETIVLLQATSPLRSADTVQEALVLFATDRYEMVCSAKQADNGYLKAGTVRSGNFIPLVDTETLFKPRQDLPNLFKLDGAVYVFNSDWLRKNRSLEAKSIGIIVSPPEETIDIDTYEDFLEAETRLNTLK